MAEGSDPVAPGRNEVDGPDAAVGRDTPAEGEQQLRASTQDSAMGRWADRRRTKIRNEIERNRRGDYKVPTWALLLILVVFVGAWVLVIALA
ncbi:MAG: hypothetical protein WCA46_07225 [Actinocatenispora sp.]